MAEHDVLKLLAKFMDGLPEAQKLSLADALCKATNRWCAEHNSTERLVLFCARHDEVPAE